MSVLLREIRRIDPQAASVLEGADIRTDSDIQFLSREDLRDLFPGNQELKRRKKIFDIIHKQKPVDVLLEELRGFIPHESLSAAVTGNGVLVDYLRILKNMKTQMDNVQTFLDAHINLLENISKPGPNQELQHGSKSTTSGTSGPVELSNNQSHDYQQAPYGSTSTTSVFTGLLKPLKSQTGPQRTLGSPLRSDVSGEKGSYFSQTVKYQVFVSGETFGAHVQLMDNIKAPSLDRKLQLVENDQDPQIIFVFCPIVSRLATDANAALDDVKVSIGEKSIILVLMHHTHEVKCVTHLRTWEEYRNVVLHVPVFYHEKEHGLLKCRENKDAVSQIQSKLVEMYPSKDISADAQDESSMTGSFPGRGYYSGSQNDAQNNSGSKNSLRGWPNWWK